MKLIAFALVASSCLKTQPMPPAFEPGTCVQVCARLSELKCAEAEPTHDGTTCTQVCQYVEDSGFIHWNLGCIGKATSCQAIDSCNLQ